MGGALFFAAGLVSSAVGAAVAGLPWVAIAAAAAAIPYVAIGAAGAVESVRSRHSPPRPMP